jgi:hypothetical protein
MHYGDPRPRIQVVQHREKEISSADFAGKILINSFPQRSQRVYAVMQ